MLSKVLMFLTPAQKRGLRILMVLLIIGVFFEMIGLGVIIPALSIMLKPDIGAEYPKIRPLLKLLGNPTQTQLVVFGMLILVVVNLAKALFLFYMTWRQSRFSADLSANLSQRLFLGYLHQPYTFHLQRNSSDLIRNIQSEVVLFTDVSKAAIVMSTEFSVLLTTIVFLFVVEPAGAFFVTSFLGIIAFLFHRVTKGKLLKWGKQRQINDGFAIKHLLQGLGGGQRCQTFWKRRTVFTRIFKIQFLQCKTLGKSFNTWASPQTIFRSSFCDRPCRIGDFDDFTVKTT